jgi:hypothetical protein
MFNAEIRPTAANVFSRSSVRFQTLFVAVLASPGSLLAGTGRGGVDDHACILEGNEERIMH